MIDAIAMKFTYGSAVMINDKRDVTGTSYEGICMCVFELLGLVSDLFFLFI